MNWRRIRSSIAVNVAGGIVLIAFAGICYFAVFTGPALVLDYSGINAGNLSDEERLAALNDNRATLLSVVAGIAAVGVAYAALWQAAGSRLDRRRQQGVEWLEVFSKAASELRTSSPTAQLAGVLTLIRLASTDSERHARDSIRQLLAAFLRERVGRADEPVQLALEFIAMPNFDKPASIAGARLDGMDLSIVRLDRLLVERVSFRDCRLPSRARDHITKSSAVDIAGVTWS